MIPSPSIPVGLLRACAARGLACCLLSLATAIGFSMRSWAAEPVSFELDVQPVLTANGCNTGACHGKQRGQNGFQLSLLGFDPQFDHEAIALQSHGRRLSIGQPEESLLLLKATAKLPHGGGPILEESSPDFNTLSKWIHQGAPRKIPGEPSLERIELANSEFTLAASQSAALKLKAHYSDGSSRDVTRLATYLSNDSAIASTDKLGQITAGELPGETAIMVRFSNQIQVAQVRIPRTENLPSDFYATKGANNFVDELIFAKLAELSIKTSEDTVDSVFLRRAYTDIIGRLPSAAEAKDYLSSSSPTKDEELVNYLLEQPAYVDHWSNIWMDLLRPNPYRVGIKAVLNYDNWIRQQFRDDVPLDVFATRLITAQGSTWHNGAVTLFRDRRSPDEMVTLVSQLFLGVRLECAKCHHHPFERWSQKDFYSLAAYFAKVRHKGTGLSPPISGSEEVIFSSDNGEVRHPVTEEVLEPAPLFPIDSIPKRESSDNNLDPREELAAWITSKDNPYFAQVMANRIWSLLMGRGLVEPVDDLRSTNPATNPALLEALAKHLRDVGFDQKELIRTIALSRAYRLSSTPNESNASDRLNYSRHFRARLRGEILADAIDSVTETSTRYDAMPPDARAAQIWTHRVDSMFLDTFGRPNENQDPPCERTADSSVTQSLHLMNSRELDRRIRSAEGRARRLAENGNAPRAIVDELYLSIFSRFPSDSEAKYAIGLIEAAGKERQGPIEDLMWAMLNSPEFSIQN